MYLGCVSKQVAEATHAVYSRLLSALEMADEAISKRTKQFVASSSSSFAWNSCAVDLQFSQNIS